MKKFYTLLFSAVSAFAVSTAPAQAAVVLPVTHAQLNAESVNPAAQQSERVTLRSAAESMQQVNNTNSVQVQPLADGTNTWTSIGTGVWVEGPLDYYSDIEAGSQWEVEIEQSAEIPGFYRLIPYCEGSVPATLLGRADNTYIYVHAEDPTHVYTMGGETDGSANNDWLTAFYGGSFNIAQYCSETGFTAGTAYGTLADNVISFPANSHALYVNSSWKLSNNGGKFKIYLPGADVKDYTFESEAEVCYTSDRVPFKVTKTGADVANVYCSIYPAAYSGDAVINQVYGFVKGDATKKIAVGNQYTFNDNPGVYSIFLIATDANDEFVNGCIHHVFCLNDDTENWTTLGTGTFVDPILVDAQYGAQGQTTGFELQVTVQQNVNTPGLFRIANPYDTLLGEDKIDHVSHNHYIYFDVTNPEEGKIQYYPVGFDGGYGAMSARSVNERYSGNTAAELVEAGYGIITYDEDTNTINIPAKSVFYAEKNYSNNAFFYSQIPGSLTIPELTDIKDVFGDDDSDAKVEYFNLQGMQIDNPTNGIYICRKGTKVAKVFVK